MSISIYTPDSTRILHYSKVDFSERIVPKTVHVVQYDNNLPVICVSLFNNSSNYSLPINTRDVKLRFGKSDGTYVYKNILGVSSDYKTVYFDIDDQMSLYYGEFNPVLEVTANNGDIASSSSIPISIDKNPVQNTSAKSISNYPNIILSLDQIVVNPININSSVSFTLNTTSEQQAILSDERIQIIKLDLSSFGNLVPVPYLWIKRNTKLTLSGKTLHQFSFDNAGFYYDYATTIGIVALNKIGNGGIIYESTTTKYLFVSYENFNIDTLIQNFTDRPTFTITNGTLNFKSLKDIDIQFNGTSGSIIIKGARGKIFSLDNCSSENNYYLTIRSGAVYDKTTATHLMHNAYTEYDMFSKCAIITLDEANIEYSGAGSYKITFSIN